MKKKMTFGSQAIWNDALCAKPDPELCVPASRRVCLFESRSVHGVRLATGNVEYSVDQAGSFEPDQSALSQSELRVAQISRHAIASGSTEG